MDFQALFGLTVIPAAKLHGAITLSISNQFRGLCSDCLPFRLRVTDRMAADFLKPNRSDFALETS